MSGFQSEGIVQIQEAYRDTAEFKKLTEEIAAVVKCDALPINTASEKDHFIERAVSSVNSLRSKVKSLIPSE